MRQKSWFLQGKGIKLLTPKEMLHRLPIAFAQLKAGNTSENLPSKNRELAYSLWPLKEATKKLYNNIMNSIQI